MYELNFMLTISGTADQIVTKIHSELLITGTIQYIINMVFTITLPF